MGNGLDIGLKEFKGMRSMDRDVLMYSNLTNIRSKIDNYKLHQKVQYPWLILLSGAAIFIIKNLVGGN